MKLKARIRRFTIDLGLQLVAVVVGKFHSEMNTRVESIEYIEEIFGCIESRQWFIVQTCCDVRFFFHVIADEITE